MPFMSAHAHQHSLLVVGMSVYINIAQLIHILTHDNVQVYYNTDATTQNNQFIYMLQQFITCAL